MHSCRCNVFQEAENEEKVKDPERRFRSNVDELFLDNQVSADRIMSVFEDAKLAGTKHISDLCSKTKSKTKKKFRKNAQRDLLRRLLKKSVASCICCFHQDLRPKNTNHQMDRLPFFIAT